MVNIAIMGLQNAYAGNYTKYTREEFYVRVTVHLNKFLYNITN
jgi:hypothetical protein